MISRWYIAAAAVREYMALAGHPDTEDGFDGAAKELEAIAAEARLQKDEGHRQIWLVKAKLHGRMQRLELTVSTAKRPEGHLPQLVRVRTK